MAEELQNLLERIRKEGVDKAQAEAELIVAEARRKASELTAAAEKTAADIRKQAERDAATSAERGRKTLQQAARDVILSVGVGVDALVRRLTHDKIGGALQGEDLRRIIAKVVETYAKAGPEGGQIEVLLPEEEQKRIAGAVLSDLAEEIRSGVRVRANGTVADGFRVSVSHGRIEHDFSADAIAEAICRIVRPHLAEIVRSALAEGLTDPREK